MGFMKVSKNKTTLLATRPENEIASVSFHLLGALVSLCVTTELKDFGSNQNQWWQVL